MQDKVNKPKINLSFNSQFTFVKKTVAAHDLHTICESGLCPNKTECWGRGTATFMILGDICTRSCRFCNVKTGKPNIPDEDEPLRIAKSVALMKLKHAVITSVDRDDLDDGGAVHWKKTIEAIRALNPETTIETLIPDFKGDKECLGEIVSVAPEVVSHNLETVKELTKKVRPQARYQRSMQVLKYLAESGMRTKTGLMLGLGEKYSQVKQAMNEIRESGCVILTLGQYLQPTEMHLPVEEYISDNLFAEYKDLGYSIGFEVVESSSVVRSSYRAENQVKPS